MSKILSLAKGEIYGRIKRFVLKVFSCFYKKESIYLRSNRNCKYVDFVYYNPQTDNFGEKKMVYYNRLQWTLWIKKSLEEWLKTGTGSSYHPFVEHFRMWLEPHEVLVNLYGSLIRTQQDLFNEALADVLRKIDPSANAPLFRELIRLMEGIKSDITFEVLTEIMESNKIPESVFSPNFDGTYHLLEEATEIAERFCTN